MGDNDLYPEKETTPYVNFSSVKSRLRRYTLAIIAIALLIMLLGLLYGYYTNQPPRTSIELFSEIPDTNEIDLEFLQNVSESNFSLNNINYEFWTFIHRWPTLGGHGPVAITLHLDPNLDIQMITFWIVHLEDFYLEDPSFKVSYESRDGSDPGLITTPYFWGCDSEISIYLLLQLKKYDKYIFVSDIDRLILCINV